MKASDFNERTQRAIRAQLVPKAAPIEPLPFHAPSNVSLDKESDIHDQIIAECRKRRWYFVHSRTDKRTTTQLGVPDFIIFANYGKVFACEIKRKGGKLSREQNITKYCLLALEQKYKTIYSFEEFVEFVT